MPSLLSASEIDFARSLDPDNKTDYRPQICDFEDDIFHTTYQAGHRLMEEVDAKWLIHDVFSAFKRNVPKLFLVKGFDDPRVGGWADVQNHRIEIERGYLYRFLVLHESAHLLVPEDRNHGPTFTYILQLLYREHIGIPEHDMQRFLRRHGLPSLTGRHELLARYAQAI